MGVHPGGLQASSVCYEKEVRALAFVPRVSPASRLVAASVLIALLVLVATKNAREPVSAAQTLAASTAAPSSRSAQTGGRPAASALASLSQPTPLATNTSPIGSQDPGSGHSSRSPGASASSGVSADGSLVELLAILHIAPESRNGYERTLFEHWIDQDMDGCDTRREVLISEAVIPPTVGANCSLTVGEWLSLYDGVSVTDVESLDIDHVVPLAEAWDSGASGWTAERRRRFANDLEVPWALVAVTASSNRSKSDRDPAEWMPPVDQFACTYVAWWVEVKVRWSLNVDPTELDALRNQASSCSDTRASIVLAP
jgi:hypothetical protein